MSESGPFWTRLDARLPTDGDALDLGTGTGRVAFHVAPQARRVLGVDIDPDAVQWARRDAERRGITNVTFLHGDAERADALAAKGGSAFRLATARLFFSLSLIHRVRSLLEAGGWFVFEALEARHWHEAGGSRFNVGVDQTRNELSLAGFDDVDLDVEVRTATFADTAAARENLKERRLWTRWRGDGRWEAWRKHARSAGWTLTDAHLVGAARAVEAARAPPRFISKPGLGQ